METSAINCLLKPIPIMFSQTFAYHNQFVTSAGSDINMDAQVYLLYEVPVVLLARRFLYKKNDHVQIMVSQFFFLLHFYQKLGVTKEKILFIFNFFFQIKIKNLNSFK